MIGIIILEKYKKGKLEFSRLVACVCVKALGL